MQCYIALKLATVSIRQGQASNAPGTSTAFGRLFNPEIAFGLDVEFQDGPTFHAIEAAALRMFGCRLLRFSMGPGC